MITMIQCHFEISGVRKDGGYDSGLRSCFELFEMFFEVKNLHFLPASSVR